MSSVRQVADSEVGAYVEGLARAARGAAPAMAAAGSEIKNRLLRHMAEGLTRERARILAANALDLAAGRAAGLDAALLDRLELTEARVEAMAAGLRDIIALPDPVGEIEALRPRPSGIQVGHMRVPLGVVAIIYESRPNVTIDAAALCLKSGNAAVLRGGSEAVRSNLALAGIIRAALSTVGLPVDALQVLDRTEREAVDVLIALPGLVDVVIPRGGKSLIELVSRKARVPVIKHLHGNCHVYIDGRADLAKAVPIAINAKTQRYGTCNTMETLLVARAVAAQVLPVLAAEYVARGVELRGCPESRALVPAMHPATETDWETEYLAPILAVRVVADLAEAIAHIGRYGSQHTDAIVTEDWSAARRFLREVDSSSVMVNASTRFADGFEYGLGAEIGISTDKFHVRGPVGLEGLTSQKYVVLGDGQVRGD